MDIQSLNRLKGKKSKETGSSGPITKLSADEWNTLVQGVIDHYIDSPYKVVLNSEDNVITFTDFQGNTSTYELTPYIPRTVTKVEFKDGSITVPLVSAAQSTASIIITNPTKFKITYNNGDSEESVIEDTSKITYSISFASNEGFDNIQISNRNISNIPEYTGTSERPLGTISCVFSYNGTVSGKTVTTLTKTKELKQAGIPIPNILLYGEKSLNVNTGKAIKNGEDTVENNIDLSNVVLEEYDYILDDGNNNNHSDEITPNTQTSGYFIQIFLVRNSTHKIYSFDSSGFSTEPKTLVENTRVLNQSDNTIYRINDYSYTKEGVSDNYKALFILKQTNGPEDLCLLIDNK